MSTNWLFKIHVRENLYTLIEQSVGYIYGWIIKLTDCEVLFWLLGSWYKPMCSASSHIIFIVNKKAQ